MQRHSIERFTDFEPGRVTRNGVAYRQTQEFVSEEITRYMERYRAQQQIDQTARLLRDQIDALLRRYHEYVIQGKIQAHYRQVGVKIKAGNVFEHVIPARTVRNLLIADLISVPQALNPPTCLITTANNRVLSRNRMTKRTPNCWQFWSRYQCLGIQIETWDGTPVDQTTWDLARHYEYFTTI